MKIADDLSFIKKALAQHERLFEQNTEMLIKLVELNERQVSHSDRFSEYAVRTDHRITKIETKVEANHTTILKWSGALCALLGASTILIKFI